MATYDVPTEVVLDIYQRILRIRRFEEEVGKLFKQGQLPGFVHLYIGEEAVGAGVCAALRDDDYITSTHRGTWACDCQRRGYEPHDGRTLWQSHRLLQRQRR